MRDNELLLSLLVSLETCEMNLVNFPHLDVFTVIGIWVLILLLNVKEHSMKNLYLKEICIKEINYYKEEQIMNKF